MKKSLKAAALATTLLALSLPGVKADPCVKCFRVVFPTTATQSAPEQRPAPADTSADTDQRDGE